MVYSPAMPLPVLADVFRVTFNITAGGQPTVHNVIHVHAPFSTEADLGALIEAFMSGAPSNNPWAIMDSDYVVSSLSVLALDGVSAGIEVSIGDPLSGEADGQTIYNLAGVCTFHTEQRGPRGRGRVYIGPITEGVWTGSALEALPMAEVENGWRDLQAALVADSIANSIVVASYTHEDFHPVTNFVSHTYGASMARRLYATR